MAVNIKNSPILDSAIFPPKIAGRKPNLNVRLSRRSVTRSLLHAEAAAGSRIARPSRARRKFGNNRVGTFIRRRRERKNCGREFYGTEEFSGIIKPPPGFVPIAPQQLKFAET